MISLKVSVFSSIFLFSFTGFAANESIHAASNVSAGRAVLQISGNVRSLVAINLTDAKVSTIKSSIDQK